MKQVKIISVIIFLLFLSNACTNVCKEYENNVYRPLEYKMIVTGKYIYSRYYRIIGREQTSIIDTTEESAIDKDEYELIEIGDTLFKKKNTLSLFIIKKDTTIEFPQFCR